MINYCLVISAGLATCQSISPYVRLTDEQILGSNCQLLTKDVTLAKGKESGTAMQRLKRTRRQLLWAHMGTSVSGHRVLRSEPSWMCQ